MILQCGVQWHSIRSRASSRGAAGAKGTTAGKPKYSMAILSVYVVRILAIRNRGSRIMGTSLGPWGSVSLIYKNQLGSDPRIVIYVNRAYLYALKLHSRVAPEISKKSSRSRDAC